VDAITAWFDDSQAPPVEATNGAFEKFDVAAADKLLPQNADAVRACLRFSGSDCQQCHMDKLQTGIEFGFAVFPQSPVLFQPGKALVPRSNVEA